jgi:hypothetical protein
MRNQLTRCTGWKTCESKVFKNVFSLSWVWVMNQSECREHNRRADYASKVDNPPALLPPQRVPYGRRDPKDKQADLWLLIFPIVFMLPSVLCILPLCILSQYRTRAELTSARAGRVVPQIKRPCGSRLSINSIDFSYLSYRQ